MISWTRATFDPAQVDQVITSQFERLQNYLITVLPKRHPHRVAVCPHGGAAYRQERVYFVPAVLNAHMLGDKEIKDLIRACVDLLDQETTDFQPRSVIIFFPDIYPPLQLLRIRHSIANEVQARGYVIGASNPYDASLGDYGNAWHPYQMPMPAINMRHIVAKDLKTADFRGGYKRAWLHQKLRLLNQMHAAISQVRTEESEEGIRYIHQLRKKCLWRLAAYGLSMVMVGTLLASF